MNNEEAKFILQGYRPDGTDAHDAAFRAALDQVGRDPALRDWFARQQAFDSAVSAGLRELSAPAGLRNAILAGGRVTTADETPARWWRSPALLAAAAGVAVVLTATFTLWPNQAGADTGLAEHVLADVANEGTHRESRGTDSLVARLADPANRLGRGLQVDFDVLRKAGCRTLTYQGREMIEVCFNRDGVWFHAYIGRRADFPALAADPSFLDKAGVSVASWADSSHVYLVASTAGRAALERLL